MDELIEGVVAPVVTPIADGELATDRVADSVEFTLNCGCHAVVASGTGVQETVALTPDERKTLISETVDAVNDRVPVLAGVSYPAQSVVSDLINHAESENVDGLLVMPPWGLEPSDSAIIEYYEEIAAKTDLPILVYNNPSITVDLDRELMRSISKIDGIKYIKESSRDWQKVGWLLEKIHHAGHAEVFTTMDVLLPTLQSGGSGAIIPAPATVPSMRVYKAHKSGDLEKAISAQRTFGSFPPDEASTGLTAVCKAATQLAGVDVGPPRPPYDSVDAEGRKAIEQWLNEQNIPQA